MGEWHGYILVEKPGALSMAEWGEALVALYAAWDRVPASNRPAYRLHSRLSLDQRKVIIEASFDTDQVTVQRAAEIVQAALPGYTVDQVMAAMQNNIHTQRMGESWVASNAEVRGYLEVYLSEWGEDEAGA